MVLRAMMARVRAICACATSREARAWSTSSWATALCSLSVSSRRSLVPARAASASSASSSACSTETSRATSNAPASTTWPGVSVARLTVPDTSLRKVIERRASTVPTEVVVARCSRSPATAAVTDSIGSG
jgi:hypothetical protein